MAGTIIYFDIAGAVIYTGLISYILARKLYRGKSNNSFFLLVVVCAIVCFLDIFCVYTENHPYAASQLSRSIVVSLYLFLHNLTALLFVVYLTVLTDVWHILEQDVLFNIITPIPLVFETIALITNFSNGKVFYFAEGNIYKRGPVMGTFYICAAFYLIMGVFLMLKYREILGKDIYISCLLVYAFMIASIAIQFIIPNLVVEMFAISLALIFATESMQRPNEYLEAGGNFYSRKAFLNDMRKVFLNKKDTVLVVVHILNYRVMWNMLGYEQLEIITRNYSEKLIQISQKQRVVDGIYHADSGCFVVMLGRKHKDQAEHYVEAIRKQLENKIEAGMLKLEVQSSIWTIDTQNDITDIDLLMLFLRESTKAEYVGTVHSAQEILSKGNFNIIRNLDMILDRAFEEERFEVFYQPIYSVKDKTFKSAEALIRLRDYEFGFIPPDVFIPRAEENGSIHRIGLWVFEEVCKFITSPEYKELGVDYVEINVSSVQCMNENMCRFIMDIMKKYGVRSDQINLEITETAASMENETFEANINALAEMGISFSLDDYGTGYSNAQRICTLPLSIIKLDKGFIGLKDTPRFKEIARTTIKNLKNLGMGIVVEGVETEDVLEEFSEYGVDYIQGYYFSKPVPQNEFIEFIHKYQNSNT